MYLFIYKIDYTIILLVIGFILIIILLVILYFMCDDIFKKKSEERKRNIKNQDIFKMIEKTKSDRRIKYYSPTHKMRQKAAKSDSAIKYGYYRPKSVTTTLPFISFFK